MISLESPEELQTISLISVNDLTSTADQDSLNYLLDRMHNPASEPAFYNLLGNNYTMQFPKDFIESEDAQGNSNSDDLDEATSNYIEYEDDPDSSQNPDEYWLDVERITHNLENLNFPAIYHKLVDSRPFVTLQSLEEEILSTYKLTINIEFKLVEEYLHRFFSGIVNNFTEDGGSNGTYIALGTIYNEFTTEDFVLQVTRNKFNQLIVNLA